MFLPRPLKPWQETWFDSKKNLGTNWFELCSVLVTHVYQNHFYSTASVNGTAGCVVSNQQGLQTNHPSYYQMLEAVIAGRKEGDIADGVQLAPGMLLQIIILMGRNFMFCCCFLKSAFSSALLYISFIDISFIDFLLTQIQLNHIPVHF